MITQTTPSLKVFLYYKHTDLKWAENIRQVLSEHTAWELIPDILAKELPDWGELWEEQMQQGNIFVTLISRLFTQSPGNREELSAILDRVEKGEAYIIPIIL